MTPQELNSGEVPTLSMIEKAKALLDSDRDIKALRAKDMDMDREGLRNNQLRLAVAEKLMADPANAQYSDVAALEQEIERQIPGYEAKMAFNQAVENPETKSFWSRSLDKVKSAASAVGGHVKRNWWKYAIAAAVVAGGYFAYQYWNWDKLAALAHTDAGTAAGAVKEVAVGAPEVTAPGVVPALTNTPGSGGMAPLIESAAKKAAKVY